MDSSIHEKTEAYWNTSSWRRLIFCFALYFIGLAMSFAIISEPFTMKTYFSDNSLLPGLVNREFSLGMETEYYLRDMDVLTKTSNRDPQSSDSNTSLQNTQTIVNFIKHEFNNFGLRILEQSFNYSGLTSKHKSNIHGLNLYSIIRAERSSNSEAILLCSPYYRYSAFNNTHPSISLTLALAKYFSSQSYWAKDIIILFVDQGKYGMSAWVDAYHDTDLMSVKKNNDYSLGYISYQDLIERSGPLQAGIVLELFTRKFTKLDIKILGMNGQLPNLDLFNLVVELSARESVTPYINGKSIPFDLDPRELYLHNLASIWSMVKSQATMNPDGLHGYLQKYSIQSLTILGPSMKIAKESKFIYASLLNVGRLLEGVFRSLNNLVERFNRSYYFYLISSVRRFTSIAYYMVAQGLMVSSLVLNAWMQYQQGLQYNVQFKDVIESAAIKKFSLVYGIYQCLASYTYISVAVIASIILNLTQCPSGQFLTTLLFLVVGTVVSRHLIVGKKSEDSHECKSISIIANLNLAILLGLLSVINISTALIIAVLSIPPALLSDLPRGLVRTVFSNTSLIYWGMILYYVGYYISIHVAFEDFYLFGNHAFLILPVLSACTPRVK